MASFDRTSSANAFASIPAALLRVAVLSVTPKPDSIWLAQSVRRLNLEVIMVRCGRLVSSSLMAEKFLRLGLVRVIRGSPQKTENKAR